VITSLKIKGYRGIRNCELTDLSKINIFIGRNNSGKSSLLEALYLASAAFNFRDPLKRYSNKIEYLLNRRCERGLRWNQGKEALWYAYDLTKPISIEIELMKNAELRIELFNWHLHPLIEIDPKISLKYFPSRTPPSDSICLTESHMINLKTKSQMEPGTDTFLSVLDTALGGQKDEIKTFMEHFILVDTSLIHEMERAEKALWNDLLKERLDKLVTQVLRQGYEIEVEDITYVPYGDIYQLAIKLPETTIRADDLGDGARYSMIVVMIAALAKNTAILIEEPENHQHPGGLTKSLEMLVALIKQNNIQLFASTHSIEFVRLIGEIAKEKKVEIATFFLERDKDGNVESRHITPQDAEILEKMGLDPRFLDVI
jgi:predicted ATP-dependent endonuclease of OLD family